MANNAIATLAEVSGIIGTIAKFFRILFKVGVSWEQFRLVIDDRKARRNLAEYLKLGCPDLNGKFVFVQSEKLVLEVDFDLTWEEALKAGGYDSQYIDSAFNSTKLPPNNLTGKHNILFGLNKRDKDTTSQEWLDCLKGLDEPFIDPRVLLALGAKFRDKQRTAPIFVLWFDSEGQLWCLVLGESGGDRRVGVGRDYLDDYWRGYYLAASARK
ncbi:MAG: hypothetical protein Q8O59_03100 [bacterium]|nr:hypothetical protein [bacterium]